MTLRTMLTFVGLIIVATVFSPGAAGQEQTSWESLKEVDYKEVETADGSLWVPEFAPDVEVLENKSVRLAGYMIPLGNEEKQTHFLISAWPGDGCYFHLPGGPNSVVEIQAADGFDFTYDTIAIEGRLELLRDDPYGLLYRMVDAKPAR